MKLVIIIRNFNSCIGCSICEGSAPKIFMGKGEKLARQSHLNSKNQWVGYINISTRTHY